MCDRYLIETFDRLFKKYPSKALSALIVESGYGTSVKCVFDRVDSYVPVLRIPNVASEKVNFHDLKYGYLNSKELESTTLQEGDILLVRTNGSAELVGRSAVVPSLLELMSFASYLIRLRCDDNFIIPSYLQLALKYLRINGLLFDLARTTAGQYNVSLGRLNISQIPLPPISIQEQLVKAANLLQSKIETINEIREIALKEFDALLPAILDKAFKGEL